MGGDFVDARGPFFHVPTGSETLGELGYFGSFRRAALRLTVGQDSPKGFAKAPATFLPLGRQRAGKTSFFFAEL
jgi:hypothetical protein